MAHKPKRTKPFSLIVFPIRNGVWAQTIEIRQWLPIQLTGKILDAIPSSHNPKVSPHLFPIRQKILQLSDLGTMMSGLKPRDAQQKLEIWESEELAELLGEHIEPRTQNSAVVAYLRELPVGSHVVLRWQY